MINLLLKIFTRFRRRSYSFIGIKEIIKHNYNS
nr:MAG TPA: hypothetical protein [Bacteriophage sp.]